ncbi:MAG: DUF6483 family protein [Firmicutes bacterium]|nr:DUF6483 family protein [Bacillota bacterium]
MDDIQKILQKGGAVLAKIFTGKEIKNELIAEFEELEPTEIFTIALGLIAEEKYSECEDFLFKHIEKDYTDELFRLGKAIIENVVSLGDDVLQEGDYSLEDALAWQADWIKLHVPLDNFENRDERQNPNFTGKKAKKIIAKKSRRQLYNETPQV